MPSLVGREVGPVGYGMMGLTLGSNPKSLEVCFTAMKKALSMGANFWNAGEFYGTPEHNSLHVLAAYFEKYPEDAEKVVLSVKVGFSQTTISQDNSAVSLRRSAENCVELLNGRKSIDIFQPARQDPKVPVEEAMKTLIELRDEGLFKGIGLSEVSAETVNRAAKVGDIAAVEVEISLWSTDPLNNGLLNTCAELHIPVIGYGPLGQGFLTGAIKSPDDLAPDDHRHWSPRFQPDAFAGNLKLVDQVKAIADKKGVPPSQIAVAWVKSLGRDGMAVIPLPGASSEARVEENSTVVELSSIELESIDEILKAFKVQGDRYGGPLADLMDG